MLPFDTSLFLWLNASASSPEWVLKLALFSAQDGQNFVEFAVLFKKGIHVKVVAAQLAVAGLYFALLPLEGFHQLSRFFAFAVLVFKPFQFAA